MLTETARSLIDSFLDSLREGFLEGLEYLNSLGEEEKKEFLELLEIFKEIEQGTKATAEMAAEPKT